MRRYLFVAAALAGVATPAFAESWDFVLVNKTGKPIKLVEISESGKADWKKEKIEEDMAKSDIKPGADHTVHFDKEGKTCAFDVRLTFADDSQAVWTNFNACNYAFGDFSFKGDLPVVKGT